jgi:hypothetical protein
MFSVDDITLVFSYWIFAWYLLYEFKVTFYNPQFAIICGVLENIVVFLMMLYYKNKGIYLAAFFFINSCIKLVPLWRLRNTQFTEDDVGASCFLFLFYLAWLQVNDLRLEDMIVDGQTLIRENKPVAPFISFISRL